MTQHGRTAADYEGDIQRLLSSLGDDGSRTPAEPSPAGQRLAPGEYVEIRTGDPRRWQRFAGPMTPEAAAVEVARAARIFGGARIYRIA